MLSRIVQKLDYLLVGQAIGALVIGVTLILGGLIAWKLSVKAEPVQRVKPLVLGEVGLAVPGRQISDRTLLARRRTGKIRIQMSSPAVSFSTMVLPGVACCTMRLESTWS